MTDITATIARLRELLGKATPGPHHIYTHPRDDNNWQANQAWHEACTPQVVAGLLDEIERERDALKAENARLRSAGGQLSNIAFNLAQHVGRTLDARDVAALDKCRRAWDAAMQEQPK